MTATAEAVRGEVTSLTERALMRRVIVRLMPIVTFIYLIAIIDRANIGFVKLQMAQDLHMSEAIYGLGASLFFIGYLVFEIPSTLAVHHFGARGWLARIMLSWGIVTILLAFAYSATSFYVLRLLLGIAEAGCYPGLIYFITLWFPPSYRVGAVGVLTLGSAFGNMLGSLLGGFLLDLNGTLGFAGWQWVFLATGVPAVIMSFLILLFLPSTPEQGRFLSAPEKKLACRRNPARTGGAARTRSLLVRDRRSPRAVLLRDLCADPVRALRRDLLDPHGGEGVRGHRNAKRAALIAAVGGRCFGADDHSAPPEAGVRGAARDGRPGPDRATRLFGKHAGGRELDALCRHGDRHPMHIAAAALLLVAALAALRRRASRNRHRRHQHARQSRRVRCAEPDALCRAGDRKRGGRHAGSCRMHCSRWPLGCGDAPCQRGREPPRAAAGSWRTLRS